MIYLLLFAALLWGSAGPCNNESCSNSDSIDHKFNIDHEPPSLWELSRSSFADIAVSISSSDSLVFAFVNRGCQWNKQRVGKDKKFDKCKNVQSMRGVFYDSIKILKTAKDMRKIGSLFFDELVKNDSIKIYAARNRKGKIILGCPRRMSFVLFVYNFDSIRKIKFYGTSMELSTPANHREISEDYSSEFLFKISAAFDAHGAISKDCNE